MKHMHITDEAWHQLKLNLEQGDHLENTSIILGPSQAITTNVQALLGSCASQQYSLHYYLCSGSQSFRVPCYEPFMEEQVCTTLEARHVLENAEGLLTPEPATYSPRYANVELQKSIRQEKCRSPLILIEWITPPAKNDITFVQLARIAMHNIPIIIFLHQHEDDNIGLQWPSDHSTDDELSVILYMCGGRIREAEWHKLIDHYLLDPFATEHTGEQLFASRQIGQTQLICYAHRKAAERAERRFRELTPTKRTAIASSLLRALPKGSGYPFFAITYQMSNVDDILSKYALTSLKAAFSDPAGVVRYFRHLRRITRTNENSVLAGIASINYVASLLCIDSTDVTRIYRILQQADFSALDKDATARLWFTLAQSLTRVKDQQAWEDAAECYRKSRAYLNSAKIQQGPLRSRLAAIANGEALIALKLRQRDQARKLEEAALTELHDVDLSSDIIIQQVLLKTNLGEVHYRMFKDTEAAIAQYKAAYTLALSCPAPEARGYVVPKLAEALIQTKRPQEVVGILHAFLAQLRQTPGTSPLTDTMATLKMQLLLAQAYLETGQVRSAAACYWLLLRHPQQLTVPVLRGIIANLLRCRPAIQVSLQARIRRIVAQQEEILTDVASIQETLSRMR